MQNYFISLHFKTTLIHVVSEISFATLNTQSQYTESQWTGPPLHIKTVSTGMRNSIIKINRSWERLIYKMGIHINVRRYLYIEMGIWLVIPLVVSSPTASYWLNLGIFAENTIKVHLCLNLWCHDGVIHEMQTKPNKHRNKTLMISVCYAINGFGDHLYTWYRFYRTPHA